MAKKLLMQDVAAQLMEIRGRLLLPQDADVYTLETTQALSDIVMMLAGEIENLNARIDMLEGH
jgi:glycine cleavage system H lipoate-binding protein